MNEMKNVLKFLMVFTLIFGVNFILLAQDIGEGTEKSNIWNWLLTVGVGSVVALFPALWQRVKSVSLKVADLVILVMDELDNVKMQIIEVKTAAKSLIEHYKESIADDVLSKEEQKVFAVKFEKLIKELDDVPSAFTAAISRVRNYIRNWGVDKKPSKK